METHQAGGGGGGDEEQICRRNSEKFGKCKNVSGDNPYRFCDFHYMILPDILKNYINSEEIEPLTKKKKKNNLPPYEQRCSHGINKRWRCKDLRMGHDAAADGDPSVPKTRYCEKHYNYYSNYHKNHKKKKTSGDGEAAASTGRIETRDSSCSKLMNKDLTGIQPPTTDIQGGGSANLGTKRKNVQGTEWSGELGVTDFLMEKPSFITSIEMKKKRLPPDEQICSYTACGGKWKCKNFRMSHNGVPKSKYCGKHYNYYSNYHKNYKKKKRSGDCEGAVTGLTETRDSNCSNNVREEDDGSLDVRVGIQQPTSNTIVGGNFANIGRKRKNVTVGCGELESSTRIRETVVKLESLEHYKSKRFEMPVDLQKRKLECTKHQDKLVEVEETRKTAAKVEPEEWNKCFDLESQTLRVENENSTKRCVNSNLEWLVLRNGKKSSTLRCVELPNFEKIESVAWGLQNEVTQAGKKQNTNAETISGGRKDTHVFELKTEENVQGIGINKHKESESEFHNYSAEKIHSGSLHLSSGGEKVEEVEGWVCSVERPSQHGSSSKDHLEMSTKAFVNLVSDDDSGECLDESEDSDSSASLGTRMDMMAMKYRNRNEDEEMKWKFEADMLFSFEEQPELCMKAVCALYQQHISKDEMPANGLFHSSDALRATTLAKFLMDGACRGDLKKSLKELEKFDSRGVEDCKRLARRYSKQLFSIYQNRKDPNFLLATTAIHEDQTAKQ